MVKIPHPKKCLRCNGAVQYENLETGNYTFIVCDECHTIVGGYIRPKKRKRRMWSWFHFGNFLIQKI